MIQSFGDSKIVFTGQGWINATATQMPVEDIYQLLYKRFTLIYKQNPSQNARQANTTPIDWIEIQKRMIWQNRFS
ncbi:hypothetical protein M23134_05680 [Microscilla marina ATCC 23134]|uniref:Uncharacterized protein n=2 Tax=Microscilla marina TaxID=1027 RepID=A1ZID9_MICM2|nr:hypothetical protein M23134_05680 [Microscilla marina ATCC 23134]